MSIYPIYFRHEIEFSVFLRQRCNNNNNKDNNDRVLCGNAFLCVNATIGNIDQYPNYVVMKFNQSYLSSSVTTSESKN